MTALNSLVLFALSIGGGLSAWFGFCRLRTMHGPAEPALRRWVIALHAGAGLALWLLILVPVVPTLPDDMLQQWGAQWTALYVVTAAMMQAMSRWQRPVV